MHENIWNEMADYRRIFAFYSLALGLYYKNRSVSLFVYI